MNEKELPINLGEALKKNKDAMHQFDELSDSQRQAVINKTRKINSSYEMDCFIDYFSNGSLGI